MIAYSTAGERWVGNVMEADTLKGISENSSLSRVSQTRRISALAPPSSVVKRFSLAPMRQSIFLLKLTLMWLQYWPRQEKGALSKCDLHVNVEACGQMSRCCAAEEKPTVRMLPSEWVWTGRRSIVVNKRASVAAAVALLWWRLLMASLNFRHTWVMMMSSWRGAVFIRLMWIRWEARLHAWASDQTHGHWVKSAPLLLFWSGLQMHSGC